MSTVTSKPLGTPQKTNVMNTTKFLLHYQIKSLTVRDVREKAKWVKHNLIDLGPTYVKIGQFVSTRSDIFEKEMIDELKTLQDNAPPFPSSQVKTIISEELGVPFDTVYSNFQDKPLASASISQVHRAKLRTTGEDVVIKVQRPFIREFFDRDFTTLKSILDFASMMDDRKINDTKTLLNDSYKYLYDELSFKNEIENLKTFKAMLEYNEDIIVPSLYEEFSTDKIITMEYIPSRKIGSVKGVDSSEKASKLMEFFIKQIIEHGLIHSDPHPGNIGITKDDKVVLYDFGQVIKLDKAFVDSVKPLMFSIYDKDVKSVGELLVKSKALIPTKDFNINQLNSFISQLITYFENVDFKEFQLSLLDSDLDIEINFKINPTLIMVFRSLSLLEGICKELDPEFSYFKVIDLLIEDFFLDALDYRARKDFMSLFSAQSSVSQLEVLQNTIEDTNKKNVKSMNSVLGKYEKMLILLTLVNFMNIPVLAKEMLLIPILAYLLVPKQNKK